jgi:hypothetical protein
MPSVRRPSFALLVLALLAAALVAASASRADGDPASDVLYTGSVFFPYGTDISPAAQRALLETVAKAGRAGYPIRVALIGQQADLGAVTSLWGKPKQYARFLDAELRYVYDGSLLVVMPAGFGFAAAARSTTAEYRVLARLVQPSGQDGLADSAARAVAELATAAGHPVTAVDTSGGGSLLARPWLIAVAVVLVAAVGGLAAFLSSRRHRPVAEEPGEPSS